MKLLLHSGGYQFSPWRGNELAEIRTIAGQVPKCHWSPSTIDFAAGGNSSGGSTSAPHVAGMLKAIGDQPVESIEELRIIGHANSIVFALAGTVKCDDVYFDQESAIIGDSATFKAAIPKCRDVQDRFTSDAKIILLGCNGGSGSMDLLILLSHAFLRTAAGFKEEIKYTLEFGPTQLPGNVITNRTHITSRGKMKYETFGEMFGTFQTNAWNLKPDAFNSEGDIYSAMRDKDPGRGASALFWMILREFYKTPWAAMDHPYISGTAIDPTVPGLRVIWRDKAETIRVNGIPTSTSAGAHVNINPDYAAKTTPKTLKNRVTEIGKALDLVNQKKSGVIPATW